MQNQQEKNNDRQHDFFPQDLDSKTEFWFKWEDQEVLKMQKAMLVLTLNEIRDRRKSKKMRQEAWDWLFSDEDHPFSSEVCATNNGYDINELRSLVKRIIKDL